VLYIDGGCYRVPTVLETAPVVYAAIGVFWGNYDTRNVSAAGQLSPFSNQRAELETMVTALNQARTARIPIVLRTDSPYAVANIIGHLSPWVKLTPQTERDQRILRRSWGVDVTNAYLSLPVRK
jgi:ribonuclease HI